MKALIVAAGQGKRLEQITGGKIPKVMVPVLGKPMLAHHLELLRQNGIRDIFINLYTKPESIIDYLGTGEKFGVNITYSHENTKESYRGPLLLGSAGALHNFKDKLTGDFFILYGDVFLSVDLRKMLAFHRKKKSLFTIAVHPSKHPLDSDLVIMNPNQKITDWIKTPHQYKKGVNSAGLYIMNAKLFRFLPPIVPYDFAHDFIPSVIAKIPSFGYYTDELMMDIGTPQRYDSLKNIIRNG